MGEREGLAVLVVLRLFPGFLPALEVRTEVLVRWVRAKAAGLTWRVEPR